MFGGFKTRLLVILTVLIASATILWLTAPAQERTREVVFLLVTTTLYSSLAVVSGFKLGRDILRRETLLAVLFAWTWWIALGGVIYGLLKHHPLMVLVVVPLGLMLLWGVSMKLANWINRRRAQRAA